MKPSIPFASGPQSSRSGPCSHFRNWWAPLLIFLVVLFLAAPAWSTLVPTMTVEEMIDESAIVVHSKVWRTWTAWDDERQFIWTHYEILVADTLKGSADGKVVISEPGGTVGELSMSIVGSPRYQVGEEVILLAYRTPIGYLRTCGWGQGTFSVQADSASGVKIVRTNRLGVELVEPLSKGVQATRARGGPAKALDGLALSEFKSRFRALIQARSAKEGR